MPSVPSTDPYLALQEAVALHNAGECEAAFIKYCWCFDHGCEADASFYCIRSSFLIGYMAKLGFHLPNSRRFLDTQRSSLESRFASTTLDIREMQLLFALNRDLGRPELTILAIVQKAINGGWQDDELQSALSVAAGDIQFWLGHCDDLLRCATTLIYGIEILTRTDRVTGAFIHNCNASPRSPIRGIVQGMNALVSASVKFFYDGGQPEKAIQAQDALKAGPAHASGEPA